MLKAKLVILLLLTLAFSALAQEDHYRFSRIDDNKGLSHNQIKAFFKDSHGFMWFGTISGLNRFDGYTIKIFRNDPSDSASIIHDDINKIFEDPDGRIWISTWNGLDIFDPYLEQFRSDPSEMLKRYGLPDQNISDIVKDRRGNYWFVHQNKGIFYHNREQRKTYNLNYVDVNIYTLASNNVSSLQLAANDEIRLIHRNGIIESLDPSTLKVKSRDSVLYHLYDGDSHDYRFIVDSRNDLWIYIADSNDGVYRIQTSLNKLNHYTVNSPTVRLSSDIVRGVVEDNNKMIWVGTDHGGINIIDTRDNSVRYVRHSPEDEYSLSQNSINCMYKDREGIIWAGTFKRGASFYHENIIRFPLIRQSSGNPQAIPFDDINAFAEDEKGNLWIGTNGGGLIYFDRAKNTFKQYLHNPSDQNSISTNIIVSLLYDSRKRLWIGTYFGGLNIFKDGKFIRLRNKPGDPSSISDNSIWDIFEDKSHHIYVGTLTSGLDVLDLDGKKITNFNPSRPNSIHGNYVPAFMEASDGKIWIGTGYGIEIFDPKKQTFTHYLSQSGNKSSLSNNSILSIVEDSRKRIWVGTHGGLNVFNAKTKTFSSLTTSDGLPHNSILTLVEDHQGNLWLSTPNGVSKVKVESVGDSIKTQFSNFDQFDGLQGKQFNENAALKTRKGEIVFGGANGLNIFNPDDIPENKIVPPLVITELQVLNQTVTPNTFFDGRKILSRSVSFTDKLELEHKDNVFSIEFAVLSFNHPEKSQYKYMLQGFDKHWISTSADQRKVTYTNLDPGEYVFRVIASNNDGVWEKEGVQLKITIHPPIWKTNFAFAAYAILILASLYFTRRIIQQRERMKYAIEQERQEAQRMHELDMMKMKFFTNVSHEFRTPLTLILTPIERILKKPDEPVQPGQFELIHRNAKRLLNLVNQLLDFRKLEVQEIRFVPSEGDIVNFIRETVFSFSDLSEKKAIPLRFHSEIDKLETVFDQDKLEKILFNLLSNAFKFTPEGGEVSVDLNLLDSSELKIMVKDTGIGIPADKKERIFERFFQSELPKTMVNQGSGIGLSITKEFVRAHNGTITVESEPGKGSCFIVTLPVQPVTQEHAEPVEEEKVEIESESEGASTFLGKHPVLLLVEDNEDFRFYLKDNLRLHYNIIEARDGDEGWNKVLSALPDLVVTDIMMPGLNGIDLCRKIKTDPRVSHTPVILLTARTAEEQKLQGFDSGAEDYITKPFNFEILQSRIRNLIHQRESFQRDFRQRIDVKASNLQITSLDEKLISKALQIVEAKLSDPDFSVEELAREIGMSRVHLYKKLQALTGKSPIEFIRTLRLQHAAQLLEKSQLTVSEIAYKVGFNNPKYFARYFKEEYKVLPSVYSASRRKDQN
jgi:signal transduction histidine kinase/ligand-binding sensor domain-containing protein/DNA-binding response OmpR family regulator